MSGQPITDCKKCPCCVAKAIAAEEACCRWRKAPRTGNVIVGIDVGREPTPQIHMSEPSYYRDLADAMLNPPEPSRPTPQILDHRGNPIPPRRLVRRTGYPMTGVIEALPPIESLPGITRMNAMRDHVMDYMIYGTTTVRTEGRRVQRVTTEDQQVLEVRPRTAGLARAALAEIEQNFLAYSQIQNPEFFDPSTPLERVQAARGQSTPPATRRNMSRREQRWAR